MGSDFLFIAPSFMRGAARAIDLFGVLDEYNVSRTGQEADLLALRADWQMVGLDMASAVEAYRRRLSEGQMSLFDGQTEDSSPR